ncbi:MAG: hypothetical protein B7Z74_11120, partial [Deltaproteobacteria bacterium 21-66-5]
QFLQRFLPDSKSPVDSSNPTKHFTRDRRLPLPVVLALILNMVRPGKRVGYDEVITRFFHQTGHEKGKARVKPPHKSAFCRARKKLPSDVLPALFERALAHARELAENFWENTWKGRRVFAIDGTKVILPRTPTLLDQFGKCSHAYFPQAHVCTLFDVLAKLPDGPIPRAALIGSDLNTSNAAEAASLSGKTGGTGS